MKAVAKIKLDVSTMYDLCDTGAVFYQLSCQANWKLVMSWVHDEPIDGKDMVELPHVFNSKQTRSFQDLQEVQKLSGTVF